MLTRNRDFRSSSDQSGNAVGNPNLFREATEAEKSSALKVSLAALSVVKRGIPATIEFPFPEYSDDDEPDPYGRTSASLPKPGLNSFEEKFLFMMPICPFIDKNNNNKWYCPCGNQCKQWRIDSNLDEDISCGKKGSFTMKGFVDHLKNKSTEKLDSKDTYHYITKIYLQNLYPRVFGKMDLPRPTTILTQAVANREVVYSSVAESNSIRRTQIDVADLSLPPVSAVSLVDNVNVDKPSDLVEEAGELLRQLMLY